MTLDPEVRAALERRTRHRLASGVEVADIYGSVGGGYGMALDDRLFEWGLDSGERELTDPIHVRLALMAGSRALPELRRLIPSRPAGSLDCARCEGTGKSCWSGHFQWLCEACGGVGWTEPPP